MRPAESFARAWSFSLATGTLWCWAVTAWFPFTHIYGESPLGVPWIRIASLLFVVVVIASATWLASSSRPGVRLVSILVALAGWWLVGGTAAYGWVVSQVNRVMTTQASLIVVGFAVVAASLGVCAVCLLRAEQPTWSWLALASLAFWVLTYVILTFGTRLAPVLADGAAVLWIVVAVQSLVWAVLATLSAGMVELGWRGLSNQRIEQTART